MMHRFLFGSILLTSCLVTTSFAQNSLQPECLNNEALRHFRLPRTPRLASDGQHVVFTIQEGAADFGVSHLWLAEVNQPKNTKQIFTI